MQKHKTKYKDMNEEQPSMLDIGSTIAGIYDTLFALYNSYIRYDNPYLKHRVQMVVEEMGRVLATAFETLYKLRNEKSALTSFINDVLFNIHSALKSLYLLDMDYFKYSGNKRFHKSNNYALLIEEDKIVFAKAINVKDLNIPVEMKLYTAHKGNSYIMLIMEVLDNLYKVLRGLEYIIYKGEVSPSTEINEKLGKLMDSLNILENFISLIAGKTRYPQPQLLSKVFMSYRIPVFLSVEIVGSRYRLPREILGFYEQLHERAKPVIEAEWNGWYVSSLSDISNGLFIIGNFEHPWWATIYVTEDEIIANIDYEVEQCSLRLNEDTCHTLSLENAEKKDLINFLSMIYSCCENDEKCRERYLDRIGVILLCLGVGD